MSKKKTIKEIIAIYDRQIRKDMVFWIKYRPSCWGNFLPEKSLILLVKLIKTNSGKRFVFISALIFSLLFVGVIPTLNFIWSNIFRLSLFLLVIPFFYWVFAIATVYGRVIAQAIYRFIRFVFYKFIHR